MDYLDVIMALEDGGLTLKNDKELEDVKAIAKSLHTSQGYYGRLYEELDNFSKQSDHQKNYPLTM